MNETELIERYLNGDTEAFSVLYEQYRKPLYSYITRSLSGSCGTAAIDDIFQKIWLKVVDNLDKYRNQDKFAAWLFRIARNMIIDYVRQAKIRSANTPLLPEDDCGSELEMIADNSSCGDALLSNAEFTEAFECAVQEISPELREVFLMRMDDISFKEIAEVQNCSINTALARMQYAIKNLSKKLGVWKKQR